jgi:hypothetical protein
LDQYHGIKSYRYVDDVLIFCNANKSSEVAKDVINRFSKIGLEVHDPIKAPHKSSMGNLGDRFSYLGYLFDGDVVSARSGSLERLKTSLVSIFTSHKHSKKKNEQFLLWRLNLRITGCIFEKKSKGWLFFFSEINDESLLHILDHYVIKLTRRFGVKVKPKKFVRAFKELKHNKYETNYIPNFDNYGVKDMRTVLANYFTFDHGKLTDLEVEFEFHKRIGKQVKDLLTDVQDFGY